MTIEFQSITGDYIKQWPNWTGVVPIAGDVVLLHFGDYNEIVKEYEVVKRYISGTDYDKVILHIKTY